MKAVIPAAGWGTRLLPVTKAVPKELLPIGKKPALHYILEEISEAGISDVLIIDNKEKGALRNYFRPAPRLENWLRTTDRKRELEQLAMIRKFPKISWVEQPNPLGLGDALLWAEEWIRDEPFALLLPDDVIDATPGCLKQMVSLYNKWQHPMIALMEVPLSEVRRYGIVKGEPTTQDLYKISYLVEKPTTQEAPSRLAIVGRYILHPELLQILRKQRKKIKRELYMTEALRESLQKNDLYGYLFKGLRLDLGDSYGLLQANIHYALKDPELKIAVQDFIQNRKGQR